MCVCVCVCVSYMYTFLSVYLKNKNSSAMIFRRLSFMNYMHYYELECLLNFSC